MIQLNLLPDVKVDYIKAQRSRRLVLTSCIVIAGVAIGLVVLLLSTAGLQKKHLSDVDTDISDYQRQLQSQPQIERILTVQNQLRGLSDLHSAKPAAKRIPEYLNALTPAQVSITNFEIKFEETTMTVTGKADSLASVNQYIDTLKFTNFTTKDDDSKRPAFSGVVLTSFKLSSDSDPPANYTITMTYDQAIFDNRQTVTLDIPSRVTTRSQALKPTDLFQASPETSEEAN